MADDNQSTIDRTQGDVNADERKLEQIVAAALRAVLQSNETGQKLVPLRAVIGQDGIPRLAVEADITVGDSVGIGSQLQVQQVELLAPLTGSPNPGSSYPGTPTDCLKYGGYSVSVTIQRAAADTNVDIFIETSHDGTTWVLQDQVNMAVTAAAATANLHQTYSPPRKFMRVRLVNNTVNALAVTQLVTMLKPVP